MLIGAKTAQDFLRFLGESGSSLSFTQGITLVVLGSCSGGQGNLHNPQVGLSTVSGGLKMNLGFWRHHLNGISGNVLIVTECCGQYDKAQIQELSDAFPEIRFVTPHISDYCDRLDSSRVREDLLSSGIIKID